MKPLITQITRIFVVLMVMFTSLVGLAKSVSLDLTGGFGVTMNKVAALMSIAGQCEDDVVREHRLTAGSANVEDLAVGDVLTLALFTDKELRIELVSERPALKGRAFLGRAQGGLGLVDCVVLETEHGLVIDVTDSANDRIWKIVSDGNGV